MRAPRRALGAFDEERRLHVWDSQRSKHGPTQSLAANAAAADAARPSIAPDNKLVIGRKP
jgi:hypothetical protein